MEKHSHGSEDCLLRGDEESIGSSYDERRPMPHRPMRSWLIRNISTRVTHLLLLYVAVLLTVNFFRTGSSDDTCRDGPAEESHPSLFGGIIKFEEKPEYHSPRYPWKQPPSLELDRLWDDLLFAQNIRITPDEMVRLNMNTTNGVRISDGDYAGALGVYHHLHCLNSMRKALHADYYAQVPESAYPKETITPEHTDHCIDTLRQALMCHANTAVYTAEWVADSHEPINKHIRGKATTTCVKWDSVNDWARQRALRGGTYKYAPGPYEKAHHGTR
ncbi:hypothetical protein F4777DRAFT_581224 [Nemania sp. FL0916]|nr:hypothetical protein F4777DRAFT_581224 [Nemania sp. FL0916]